MKDRLYRLSTIEEILIKNRWEEMSPQKRLEETGFVGDTDGFATYLEKNRKRLADMKNFQLQDRFYY